MLRGGLYRPPAPALDVQVEPQTPGWRSFPSSTKSRDNGYRPTAGSGDLCIFLSTGRGTSMAAMKPRTGDGPLEVTKEGRGIVMRVPLEGGGRLVVEMSRDEASALGDALKNVAG
jgi:hypothetical protein